MVTSPDGRFLASSGNNKIIKIWEIATTQEYRTLSGTDGRVNELIFSKDNIHLAGTSGHGELIVWNVLTGEIVHKFENGGAMKGLAFSKDGKKLIHSSSGSRLSLTNLQDGKLTETEVVSVCLTVDTNKQIVYSLDQLGNLIYFDLETESVVKKVQLFNEFNYPFGGMDVSPDGKYLAIGFNDDLVRFYDTDEHKFVYKSPKYKGKIQALKFDSKMPYLYVSSSSGKVQILDYKKFKVKSEFQEEYFTAQSLTAHPAGEIIILANFNVIVFYNVKRKKAFKKLEGKVSEIVNMAYDPTGQYLAVASNKINIQIWDLKLNKVVSTFKAFFPCEFTPDGKYLLAQNFNLNIGAWNIQDGQLEREFQTNYQLQQAVDVSDDGKYVSGGGIAMNIKVWEFESGKEIADLKGHEGIITSIDLHPSEPLVASTSYDQTTRVWDFKKKTEVQKFEDQIICVSSVKFSPDGNKIASAAWDKSIIIRTTNDWAITQKLEGHKNMITSIDFNKDGTKLVSGAGNNAVSEADNSVMFWNVNTGEMICQIQDHQSGVSKVIFDETNDRAFSSSIDGTIKINDYKSCEVVVTYVAIDESDFMLYTPDNYYMASRKALKGIAFRINNSLVPFEQFDVHLNRPDVIAERIGKSPEQLIKAYHYLYKKRLRKLNLDEGDLKIDYQIPELSIESEFDLVTTKESVKLKVKASDKKYEAGHINIFVNDVPIYGEAGYRPEKKTNSIVEEFEIPLVNNINKIQLSCTNSNGALSLLQTIEVIRQGEDEKHDLYIVAIGVSDYQDEQFRLKYPTKDATDMVRKLKEPSSLYNNVYSKTLLNEEATTQNFNQLSSFFANCTHEDLAIIFIAGHGVLNADFNYFFGTYDMDFNAPEDRGLAYDDIHALLNNIKSYRKLLIMDTCHSGELDKEEIEKGTNEETGDEDVEFRSAGVGVRKKEGFGFENSLELTQDLFSDTRKGSGATVISSAGGAEYAMESDSWNNGLFTYAFLSGLNNSAADINNDGLIQVSEIRAFVNSKVSKISAGKQIPSSREENISQDYIIFGQ